MQHKKLVACAAAVFLAVGLACSKNSDNPASPSATEPGSASANPDGSTLKATAPAPVSPVNNQQPDSLVLTANKSTALYVNPSPAFFYEFEIRNGAGTATVCPATIVGADDGSTVSYTPGCTLEFDQTYTWRVRATLGSASNAPRGPWSANATFKAPAGGFIRGNEIFDPLTNGKTVGDVFGPTEFVPGQGLRLLTHDSHVTYRLPQSLQAGEMSVMILGADEGSPGEKSKVFSMQEGPDEGDISDDDYRMSAELRGAQYFQPGQVRFRFKANEVFEDGSPSAFNFNSSRWYFWRFSWAPGSGRLQVKEDGPNGRTIYDSTVNMHGKTYKPDPHLVHLGAPVGRACACDATLPGGIYKNLWVSSQPRPAFPGE